MYDSDSGSGDGMEELQAILDDCEKEEKESNAPKKVNKKSVPSKVPEEWTKSEEEIRLEKLIFGDKEGLLENLKKSSTKSQVDAEQSQAKKRKPAWQDEDDVDVKVGDVQRKKTDAKEKPYKEVLESRFERLIRTPKWADLDKNKQEQDSDDEILQTVGFINSSKSSAKLQPTHIGFKKLKDLNRATYSEGEISSVEFHPTSTVAMVSGRSGITTLYSIDGSKNEKLHSIRFNDFPIGCAKILPCGTQAMFSSTYKYYYSYDLMQATEMRHILPGHLKKLTNFEVSPDGKYFAGCGKYGELHLLDLKSKEFLHTFKQEEVCRGIRFSLDSKKIITTSRGSTVNIFDIRMQRVMHSFLDDGCIKGYSLALSPDGKMLATGSAEGAVNIYQYDKVFTSKAPQPEKTLLNLTTSITQLNFNHTSELLAMCSAVVPAAVKLVHFPTGTVYANFPGSQSALTKIRTINFSPASGYLAMGSKQKFAPLYRLKHFSNY